MQEFEMPKMLGRYEIVRELGKGAMGVVYEGRDPVIGRRVAIKTARCEVVESSERADELMKRFLQEARAAGVINHPNVITIYDADEENGIAYIAMEYVDAGTLREFMVQKGGFTPEEVVEIGAAICDGLGAAHLLGIVHRDIKPANIMMTADGGVKVADFGIARVTGSTLTQEGALIGTPQFMSPEQFMGRRVDARSDLFSVGVILYTLLTGERPFSGEALSTVMHQVLKVDPVEPKALNYAVNDHLSTVVMKVLSKNPNDRYQSAKDLAVALRESVRAVPVPSVLQSESSDDVVPTVLMGVENAVTVAGPVPVVISSAERVGESGISREIFPAHGERRNGLVLVVGIVSAVVLAVTSYFLLMSPEGNPMPTAGAVGKMGKETRVVEGPAFAKVAVFVWAANTKEIWQAARNELLDKRMRFVNCVPGSNVVLTVQDGNSGEVLETRTVESDMMVELRRPCQRMVITCVCPGYETAVTPIFSAVKENEMKTVDVVMRKKMVKPSE